MAPISLCPTLEVESFLRKNLLAEINVQNTGKWVRYVSDGMLSLLVIECDKNYKYYKANHIRSGNVLN